MKSRAERIGLLALPGLSFLAIIYALPLLMLLLKSFQIDGQFSVAGTDKSVAWGDVTLAAYVPHNYPLEDIEPGLEETAFYDPANFTYPAGAYACEVEVDPDTGQVTIEREGDKVFVILGSDFSLDGAPAPTLGFGNGEKFDTKTEFTKLKKLNGRQVYELPKSIALSAYDTFTVWCSKFGVPLGSAKLS